VLKNLHLLLSRFKYFLLNRTRVKLIKESVEELENKITEILFSYTKEQIKFLVFYPHICKRLLMHINYIRISIRLSN
jgi:hypothetical protein